jgi:hypothetical protein
VVRFQPIFQMLLPFLFAGQLAPVLRSTQHRRTPGMQWWQWHLRVWTVGGEGAQRRDGGEPGQPPKLAQGLADEARELGQNQSPLMVLCIHSPVRSDEMVISLLN